MDEAGIDVLLATSKHNVQYLLGGHRAFFFDYMDAMGLSRYLPIVLYPKGAPEKAGFFGHRLEGFQRENKPFWTPEAQTNSSGSVDVMQKATDYLRKSGVNARRIGVEMAFLPMDSGAALRKAFPDSEIKDALFVLERLRLRKSPEELAKLKIASELVIESMQAVIANHGPGATKSGTDRGAPPRGNQSRTALRILSDHRRHQPQSRAVRSALGKGRYPLARLRRKLRRLYRRPLPHGHSGHARRRA